jgi:AAA domain
MMNKPDIKTAAVTFLAQLRRGPWMLTAIAPEGGTTKTVTVETADKLDVFVSANNNKRNLYYSVNPTRTAMTKKAAKKAAKKDIAAVEYLLADLDPADGETSEAAKARYLAQLNGAFQPKPTAIVDSGNGIQCLWRLSQPIALPPGADATIADVEARTAAIMLRLGAKPGTQNIDRILRLPGTTNLPNAKKRKEGRVACPARLISFNDASYPLAAFPLPDADNRRAASSGGSPAWVQQKRTPAAVDALPVSDRIKNLIRGIDDPEHSYPSRSERVMAVLVAMASAGCTDDQMAAVMLDRGLPIGEHVREQAKQVNYLSRQIRFARAQAKPGQRFEVKIKATLDDVLKSAADLQHKTFEPLRWIVPQYLPEGCTLLAGRPKIDKSWWGLDVGIGVATGGESLGQQCEEGDVLGLFLEDNDRRLQRRLTTMLGALKEKWPERLTYATGWPRLNDGGLDWMREWIDKARRPRLIIVDILERIRQRIAADKKSQYSADYEVLVSLQELSTEAKLSILTLVHQRKLGADDLVDTVSGTLGMGGAADAVLILGSDQFGKFLYGRGRDLEEFNVSIKQEEQRLRWRVLGIRLEAQASPERTAIISALAKAGKPMTVQEITTAVGGIKNNVKELLSKLNYEGEVERIATGVYRLPSGQADIPF